MMAGAFPITVAVTVNSLLPKSWTYGLLCASVLSLISGR